LTSSSSSINSGSISRDEYHPSDRSEYGLDEDRENEEVGLTEFGKYSS
jgi:hypothetical protein